MIHVVTGPPAAGKTTFVREHAADGDVVVDFDALATALGQSVPHSLDGAPAAVARAVRESAISEVLAGIDSDSWIIQTYLSDEKRKRFEGAEFHVVDPGIETVLAQAEADGRPEWTAEEIKAWYANGGVRKGVPMKVRKSFTVKDLATSVDGDGTFRALVSTFGTVDSQGEALQPGAFKDALAKSGGDVPILWDHQWDDIWAHIGSAKAEETDDGLVVNAQLDLDNPTAAQAFKLLQQGRVKEFSIGGFEDPADVTTEDDGTRNVAKFDLAEVSMTLRGANPDTQLLDVKTAGGVLVPDGMHIEMLTSAKAGKVLAAKHVATLRDIHKRLGSLLEEVDPPTDDSKASSPNQGEKNKEPLTVVGGSSMSERTAAAFDQIKALRAGKESK